jgi:hypothetical protein
MSEEPGTEIFRLPKPLFPTAFANAQLYKAIPRLPLYCALASTAPFLLFPKDPINTARCDVPKFFAARYFSDDEETAVQEFEHRWPGMRHRLWKGIVNLRHCLDLADDRTVGGFELTPKFLAEEPYFPWHFITACTLSAGCDSICYRSFRGTGLTYAVFALPPRSILEDFRPV